MHFLNSKKKRDPSKLLHYLGHRKESTGEVKMNYQHVTHAAGTACAFSMFLHSVLSSKDNNAMQEFSNSGVVALRTIDGILPMLRKLADRARMEFQMHS